MHREFELRDSRAKKWNIAGYEGAPALDGAAREGAKGRRERGCGTGRTIGFGGARRGVGGRGGWGRWQGARGAPSRRKKPMRFRGRLIGSRTYTYSPSTNPTVRVLIFAPCPSSRPIRLACPNLLHPSSLYVRTISFRAAPWRGVACEHNEIWNTSLTHWKRIHRRCS